jgi:vanillate/3-O-methylgallate O-demethylase
MRTWLAGRGRHATPGTAVTVVWGRQGTPQREIRATVTTLPFKPDNRRIDLATPH